MTTQRRVARTLLPLVAGALVLGGCAAKPGTAGVVNGERVTENEVSDAAREYVELTGQATDRSVVLNTLMAAEVLPDIAAEHGYAISDGEVTAAYDEQAVTLGGEASADGYSAAFIDLGRYIFLFSQIQSSPDGEQVVAEFTEAMADADITVNPRYGSPDEQGVIQPAERDWIVGSDSGA